MSDTIYHESFGQISSRMPLEAFYNAMLPLLKNYGLTAEFPADKPSLAYDGVMGIKFDVRIGEPPAAIRYKKWQESPYGMGGFELTLESETLVHTKTGDKLSLKIFITDYISGLSSANGYFWLTLRFSGAESEIERLKNTVAPVLAEYNFYSRLVKTAPVPEAPHDNSAADFIDNSKYDFITNNVNFDALVQKSFTPVLYYQETGGIDYGTPLEPFYEAMLPLLEKYGFTEKFPAGKISTLSGGYTGYEYDILIGTPPGAFRYTNAMPGGYSSFSDELRRLESIGLFHVETGDKIFIRIEISGYPESRLQANIEINGAKPQVEAFKNAFAPILAKYSFELKKVENLEDTK